LRLSLPRFLTQVKQSHGETHYQILKEVYVGGSMSRLEIAKRINLKYKISEEEAAHAITDLTVNHLLVGAQNHNKAVTDKSLKKRDAKTKSK
jgi:hypothetical protein